MFIVKSEQPVTVNVLDKRLEKQTERILTEVGGLINDFAFQVDQRFIALEKRVTHIEVSLEKLTNTLDHFLKRLDDIETDNAARDAQLARHDRWLHQIADKSGLELKH